MRIRPVNMEFLYGTSFLSQSPEAYERLILDVMRGDATLFTRNDEVEEQWRLCDPIVHAWEQTPGPLPQYPGRLTGTARGGPSDASRPVLAADLRVDEAAVASGFRHTVWTAQGTTPAEIEAALRRLLYEGQTQLSGLRAGARAQHGVRGGQAVDRRGRERACAEPAATSPRAL